MQILCTIEGIAPLLMNRFHEAAQQKASAGTSSTMAGKKGSPRDQAEPKVYVGANGKPVLPGTNFNAAVVEAGKFIKSGKSKLTTTRSSLVPAGLSILEVEAPITPSKWEVDSRAVVIPSTGGRILCHRPRFDEWRVTFTLEVDESMFDESIVRELVDLAGQRIGLGDFRPQRRGSFGRFKVVSWRKSSHG